jgi:hypothetical protein
MDLQSAKNDDSSSEMMMDAWECYASRPPPGYIQWGLNNYVCPFYALRMKLANFPDLLQELEAVASNYRQS